MGRPKGISSFLKFEGVYHKIIYFDSYSWDKTLEPIAKPVSGCQDLFSTDGGWGTVVLSPPFLKGDLDIMVKS
jgi:hypothetical protein